MNNIETKFTNHSNWNLENMSFDEQILHEQTTTFININPSSNNIAPSPPTYYVHPQVPSSSNSQIFPNFIVNHHDHVLNMEEDEEEPEEELGAMKEMMFRIAAMQPVDIDPATVRKPKRRNVRISDDPQSVAARHRRERISEKIRILQRLVPGGTKMDTASMLDEAIRYVKFLKRQIRILQNPNININNDNNNDNNNNNENIINSSNYINQYQLEGVLFGDHKLVGPTNFNSSSTLIQSLCSTSGSTGLISLGGDVGCHGGDIFCYNHKTN